MDLNKLVFNELFDTSKWRKLYAGHIDADNISEASNEDKNKLNAFMHDYIKKIYNHITISRKFTKTANGYTLLRRCSETVNKSCNAYWNIKIDVFVRQARLEYENECNHFASG